MNDFPVSQVQYTGGLGLGNRCVRTDVPFPSTRTWERSSLQAALLTRRNSGGRGPVAFLHRLMKLASAAGHAGGPLAAATAAAAAAALMSGDPTGAGVFESKDAVAVPMPFSVPLMREAGVVDVAPRLVSYFEVTIAPPAEGAALGVPECIAVGLR